MEPEAWEWEECQLAWKQARERPLQGAQVLVPVPVLEMDHPRMVLALFPE
jgi:hypothetical protein